MILPAYSKKWSGGSGGWCLLHNSCRFRERRRYADLITAPRTKTVKKRRWNDVRNKRVGPRTRLAKTYHNALRLCCAECISSKKSGDFRAGLFIARASENRTACTGYLDVATRSR